MHSKRIYFVWAIGQSVSSENGLGPTGTEENRSTQDGQSTLSDLLRCDGVRAGLFLLRGVPWIIDHTQSRKGFGCAGLPARWQLNPVLASRGSYFSPVPLENEIAWRSVM
jgi:hypothetical protein